MGVIENKISFAQVYYCIAKIFNKAAAGDIISIYPF